MVIKQLELEKEQPTDKKILLQVKELRVGLEQPTDKLLLYV